MQSPYQADYTGYPSPSQYNLQDSAYSTPSSEDWVHAIYDDLPEEPEMLFSSNSSFADLYAASSAEIASEWDKDEWWDTDETWDSDEYPMLQDVSENEDSSGDEELWYTYTDSQTIPFYRTNSDKSISLRRSYDENSSISSSLQVECQAQTAIPMESSNMKTSISQDAQYSSCYPEVRLLNQLQRINNHTTSQAYPIQVFSLTASDVTDQPSVPLITRDDVMQMILSDHYSSPTEKKIYLTILKVIRSCLKEGVWRILCTVTDSEWRDKISQRGYTDKIRMFFHKNWFNIGCPNYSQDHPIFQPISYDSVSSEVNDPTTFNPLLHPGERDLLKFSSILFYESGETLVADTIQDILDLRIRHPHLAQDLLQQGQLDKPISIPIGYVPAAQNQEVKTSNHNLILHDPDTSSQMGAKSPTESILTSSGRHPKDVIDLDEIREVIILALKHIEQILLSPQWKRVIEEEIPKDSFTYQFLQSWFKLEDDKWLPEPWPEWFTDIFMEDHISFLHRAYEVFTYNRYCTALSVSVKHLLSLQKFSPKAIEFLFDYDKLCPPHQQAHAPEIQRKDSFLAKD
jgi:hypothetical protein